uniref:Uncharacterized protein n=1 Tax=Glycine max TaxID=3847 RepID=C6TE48_SOYBN|nr:unknown [Glycine max]
MFLNWFAMLFWLLLLFPLGAPQSSACFPDFASFLMRTLGSTFPETVTFPCSASISVVNTPSIFCKIFLTLFLHPSQCMFTLRTHFCIFKNSSLLMVLEGNGAKDCKNKEGKMQKGVIVDLRNWDREKTENKLERVFRSLAYRVELLEANTEPMTEKKSVSVSE